jgi:aminopeptidase-like protein
LSGIALCTYLAKHLMERKNRYSFRFLFIPGTIGSITWLALNESATRNISHGLVVTCVGDSGGFTYKRSRRGNAEIDRAVLQVLLEGGHPHKVIDFYPYGYDERQYCSPGFNLPVGSLSRSSHGQYPEYHTSAADLQLVQPRFLAESYTTYLAVIDLLENNRTFISQNPKCEPQLGKRGLYSAVGAQERQKLDQMALLWVLNLSDGDHSLLDIAERAAMPFDSIRQSAEALVGCGLLRRG